MYTAEMLKATENKKLPQAHWEGIRVFLPKTQKCKIIENKLFDLSNGYKSSRIFPEDLAKQAKGSVMLFRPSMSKNLDEMNCLKGAKLIYSLWEGYLNKKEQEPFLDWLQHHQIPLIKIHTSGHASIKDLKTFTKAINSKSLIPIHSFETSQFKYHFDNVEMKNDGVWWEA